MTYKGNLYNCNSFQNRQKETYFNHTKIHQGPYEKKEIPTNRLKNTMNGYYINLKRQETHLLCIKMFI